MSNFREFDRETGFLLPPSLDDWLPEQHLARFVVEVIDGLDLSAMVKSYRGTGSRRFGGAFLKDIEALFVRVLELAREMGLLKMGMVTLDGTKVHANASRHSALSYEHATKIEAQLKAEVAELLARAEAADQAAVVDGMSVPEELARREDRLAKLAEARARIEARAKERFEQEMAEHRAKLAARGAAAATGKKPAGGHPHRRSRGRGPKDQINLTDADSRIMPVAGGGFDQCYNAQAVVAAESLLVIAAEVVQAPNDKQQIAPEDRRFARNRSAGPKRCWPTAAISARKPGRPARHDYEYERNGTANLFMLFAPLEGWRHVKVTDRHTRDRLRSRSQRPRQYSLYRRQDHRIGPG